MQTGMCHYAAMMAGLLCRVQEILTLLSLRCAIATPKINFYHLKRPRNPHFIEKRQWCSREAAPYKALLYDGLLARQSSNKFDSALATLHQCQGKN